MLINPYKTLDWQNHIKVNGNTHNHLMEQWHVDNAYNNGMEFIGAHPHYGKPLYPMSEHGMTLPTGAIEYALSEHYGNTDTAHPTHFAAIGSTLITDEETPHSGFEGTAYEFLDAVRNTLQTPDGGGVQWNHPGSLDTIAEGNPQFVWMKKMYDYAPDVFLGVEFYNDSQGKTYVGKDPWMKSYWDALLSSGRQVWGFANPDYEARRLEPEANWNGKEIMMVPNRTRNDVLRAIRKGQFFIALKNTGFYFTDISTDHNTTKVKLNGLGTVRFKTATRIVEVVDVNQAELLINASDIYVRIEAQQGEEQIFSQALMYKEGVETPENPPVLEPPKKRKRLVNNRSILV